MALKSGSPCRTFPDSLKPMLQILFIPFILFLAMFFGAPAWGLNVNELILKELKDNGTKLDLRHSGAIGDEGAKELAKSQLLKTLRFLGLRAHNIGDAGAQALATSPYLQNLEGLNLFYGTIGPDGANAIASSKNFGHLKYLGLWGNLLGKEGAIALGQSTSLIQLESLDLTGSNIGAEGVRAIAESPTLKNLRELRLRKNQIGDKGAEFLARSRYFRNLEVLDLSENALGLRAMEALAQAGWIGGLKELLLEKNQIGDPGLGELVGRPLSLRKLDLQWNGITLTGARALAASTGLRKLKFLELWGNYIGEDGVRVIKDSENLQQVMTPIYPGDPE